MWNCASVLTEKLQKMWSPRVMPPNVVATDTDRLPAATVGLSRIVSEINGYFGRNWQIFVPPVHLTPTLRHPLGILQRRWGWKIGWWPYQRFGDIIMCIHLCIKYEVSVFNRSKNLDGDPKKYRKSLDCWLDACSRCVISVSIELWVRFNSAAFYCTWGP